MQVTDDKSKQKSNTGTEANAAAAEEEEKQPNVISTVDDQDAVNVFNKPLKVKVSVR